MDTCASLTNFVYRTKVAHDVASLLWVWQHQDILLKSHSFNLQILAFALGKQIGLSPDRLYILSFAALLHDIGKAQIPREILNKPTVLTDEEWGIMRQHPTLGRRMAEQLCLFEVGKIIEQHHERYDGKGYPHGLVGDDISIEAQIIAVVDAYDAMMMDRPYRRALSREEARAELVRGAGTQFAPDVVRCFLEILDHIEQSSSSVKSRDQ